MNQTCVIIFSKDRPAQLDLAISSYLDHCKDPESNDVYVLYKPTSSRFISLYRQLSREHPSVRLVREKDFAADVLNIAERYKHVTFMVDDTIFIKPFSITAGTKLLDENKKSIGVSLRLGKNTTYCYPLDSPQAVPCMTRLGEDGFHSFEWINAECDFGYPLELSSSIYRVDDLMPFMKSGEYYNPNTMEERMTGLVDDFKQKMPLLICMESSVAFSAPLNLVQDVCNNRVGNTDVYSAEAMAESYKRGERLSVDHLQPITPSGCHQEVEPRAHKTGQAIPTISVIVPCYNQAHYLEEAVGSVKRQTFQDWEIIIINDGSPDDTSEVADRIITKSDGHDIRLLSINNQGLAMARNIGIGEARGAYILCLDADDRLDAKFMEATLSLLESDPDIGIAYTNLQQFGAGDELIVAADFDPKCLPIGNQLNYCSLYRREIWEDVGGYNPNLTYGYEDWDFWVGCVERGYVAKRIPAALFEYRIKDNSMFTVASQHDAELRARIVVNHPSLYKRECMSKAREILSQEGVERKMPGAPKVSVIIPTYRRPFRLFEALQSVVSQTYQDYEVLVVSDGGFDVKFVVDYFKSEMRIRLMEHPDNRGVSAARNTGLRFARGKYVAYLDDDDIFYEDHLKCLVSHLDTTGHEVAYTDAKRAKEVLVDNAYEVQSRDVPYSNDWDDDLILANNLVPILCVMHHLDCVMKSGFYDERLKTHEDWDFWIRLSREYRFHHIKEVTCEFRERKDCTSTTSAHRADFLSTAKHIFKKYQKLSKNKEVVKKQQKNLITALEQELGIKRKSISKWFMRRSKNHSHATILAEGQLSMRF